MIGRRTWLQEMCMGVFSASATQPYAAASENTNDVSRSKPLQLTDYEPRSMLHVRETHVERAKFPVIDIHTHLSHSVKSEHGVELSAEQHFFTPASDLLPVMDRRNIRSMNNLTGGYGEGVKEAIEKYDRAYPGRFYTFTTPCYSRFKEPDYPKIQAQAIEDAHNAGARGLKILKTLGLYLRENITSGTLVKVDDRRFDSMWDACGQLDIPVAMHVSDPIAFFTPTDRFNERYEELSNHPDWSFFGGDFPSNAELLEARNRVLLRHPRTQFIILHVGNFAEDLDNVSENMRRYPNMAVDIAARISELGRQPRRSRRFFEEFQDRILFGTDAVPNGHDTPQQIFCDHLYQIYFRFLETEDEYFDYAPARVPPQGRWRIYGIGLPDDILQKVYNANAARLLRVVV